MRTIQVALLAGVAAVALSGAFGFASAKSPSSHLLTVRLPGGGIEEIRYQGNVPPRVVVAPAGWAMPSLRWPAAFFGPDSAFAQIDRISAEMDRQMQTILPDADALAARPDWLTDGAASKLPPGAESYSFVSTMSANDVCAKSVEITSSGNGQKPHVVSRSYGDCGSGHARVTNGAPVENQPSDVQEVRYSPARTRAPIVREASAVE